MLAADLLNGRPPSAKGSLDDNIICIEDSDDEDEASSIPVNQRSVSEPDTVADSDTEDMTSPEEVKSKVTSVSESSMERSETELGTETEIKTEHDRKVPEGRNPRGTPVIPENHDTTVNRSIKKRKGFNLTNNPLDLKSQQLSQKSQKLRLYSAKLNVDFAWLKQTTKYTLN